MDQLLPVPPISLRGLSHRYRSGAQEQVVLREVELRIEPGESVALLGRSGSGKSTLLNLLGGLERPDRGHILIGDLDLATLAEPRRTLFRRRHIGLIYQFFNLVPTLTALENVAFVLELNGLSRAQCRERAGAMLERVGLAEKAGRFPEQLSGGERQRVAIARALVHRPAIVLADEPTGNLDASSGGAMLALLRELQDGSGSSLLLVTHSLAVARSASRLLTLEDGCIHERGAELAW